MGERGEPAYPMVTQSVCSEHSLLCGYILLLLLLQLHIGVNEDLPDLGQPGGKLQSKSHCQLYGTSLLINIKSMDIRISTRFLHSNKHTYILYMFVHICFFVIWCIGSIRIHEWWRERSVVISGRLLAKLYCLQVRI